MVCVGTPACRSNRIMVVLQAHAMSALLFTIQALMAPTLAEAQTFADVATLELDMLMDAEMRLFMPPLNANYASDLNVGENLVRFRSSQHCHLAVFA